MKKLMVIFGAALICHAASAATVLWSASESFADSAGVEFTDTRNITAYLFDAATVSQSDLFNTWNSTGTADVSGAKVTSTWYDAYQQDVTAEIGDSGTKSLYWVVVDGDKLFISSTITKDISAIGQTEYTWDNESGNVFNDRQSSFAGAGWYTAVPEPTTGLLMLVGLAGLALRRRRSA